MPKRVSALMIVAAVVFAASCASNRPAEEPETAGEMPAKAEPLKEPAPADVAPGQEPPREQPEQPAEPGKAPEHPAEAPAAQPQEAATELTEEEYKQMEAVGRMIMQARMMYQQYFSKKANGTVDAGLLQGAISTLDVVIPKLEALLKKYPDSPALKEYLSTAKEDRKALEMEK